MPVPLFEHQLVMRQELDRSYSEDIRARNRNLLLLAAVTIGVILRCLFLTRKSLWMDETGSVLFSQMKWATFGTVMWQREGNMIFYYLLLRGWLHLGSSELWIRTLSVIPAAATVPLIYWLGARLFTRKVGLVSAILLSVNACHVAYSQEARSYSLLLFMGTLSYLYFVKALENSSVRNWSLYVITSVLSLYSHFFFGFMIVAQYFSLFFLPHAAIPWKKFLFSVSAIFLLTSPALFFMLTRNAGQIDYIPHPGMMEIYHLALFLASHGGKVVGNILVLIYAAALLLTLNAFVSSWIHHKYSLENWRYALLGSWLLLPIFLTLAISHAGREIFYYRYLLICLPPFIILASYGISLLRSRALFLATLALMVSLSIAAVFRYYATPREDWRGLTRDVLSKVRDGDAILFYPPYSSAPFVFYRDRFQSKEGIPANLSREDVSAQALVESIWPKYKRVWLVVYRTDAAMGSLESALASKYRLAAVQKYSGPSAFEYVEAGVVPGKPSVRGSR